MVAEQRDIQRRTRQAEETRRNVTTIDQVRMYNANMMETFFNQKNKARAMERQDYCPTRQAGLGDR